MLIRRTISTSMKKKPRVVILGSGWGGNRLARMLNKDIYDVNVVSPANHFLFTPLLPQTTVGSLEFRTIQEPVRTIDGLGGYYQAKARSLDLEKRIVKCEDIFCKDRFDLSWDVLVLATGSKTNTFGTPGVMENEGKDVFFLKHLYHARQIRNRVLECFERAAIPNLPESERERLLSFVVVGGGPTSCEFVAELVDFVTKDVSKWYPDLTAKITLVEAGPRILGSFDQKLVDYSLGNFRGKKIDVRTDTSVTAVSCARETIIDEKTGKKHQHSDAKLSDGSTLPFGMMVWSAGLQPVKFCENTSQFARGPTGRVLVDRFLRIQLNSDLVDGEFASQGMGLGGRLYGIGDAVVNAEAPLVPLASVAEQQADYLSRVRQYILKSFNIYLIHTTTFHTSQVLNDHLATKIQHSNGDEHLPLPGKIPVSSFPPFPSFLYDKSRSFRYISRGAMSSMGSFRGLVDMSHIDTPFGKAPDHIATSDFFGFLAWHSYYFSKQYSWSNMILNPLMKFKAMCFGRDISRF